MGATLDKPTQTNERVRARATVLLMVVALLAALFMVGAALLSSVTFQSRSLAAAHQQQVKTSVIDALSREIGTALREAAVGGDGKPWNQDAASNIGNDVGGELPGVHPLLASIEPYYDSVAGTWQFFAFSDLERTVLGQPAAFDAGYFPRVALGTVLEDRAGDPAVTEDTDEAVEQGSAFDPDGAGNPDDSKYYRRDADGDGVPDTYQFKLPEGRYAPAIRGSLAETLRAEDNPNLTEDDEPHLFYAIRVIPLGAMVNLSHAHQTLIDQVVDPAEVAFLDPPYAPESEEALLRRRFLLPPHELPLSDLQGREGILPATFYFPFVPTDDINNFINGDEDARWWMVATGQDGNDIDQIQDPDPSVQDWLDWLDPDTANRYDYRHLITTVSYDDQLMRLGRSIQTAAKYQAQDWIEDILTNDAGTDGILPDNFWIQDWPTAGSPLSGRLKVSLPGLVKNVLIDSGDPTVALYAGQEIDAIGALAVDSPVREQFVRTIQDAFLLMFQNVKPATLTAAQKQKAAAALTANLIDYVDADTSGLTWVEEVNAVGERQGTYVYGLERQPYITELYGYTDQVVAVTFTDGRFAIELHNPYDVDIVLDGYNLADAGAGPMSFGMSRLSQDMSLLAPAADKTVPAQGFKVYYAAGTLNYNSPQGLSGAVALGTDWGIDATSVIQLVRTGVPNGVGAEDVVVDEFAGSFGTGSIGADLGVPGGTNEVRIERDTRNWRFVVNKAQETIGLGTGTDHTLEGANSYVDDGIKPVHVDFANTGDVTTAFPTTGSLLLLCQYANTASAPFTASLTDGTGSEGRVDNGRLPIFDDTAHTNWADPPGTAGPLKLHIPWGQLVFDYFTALPLTHTHSPLDDITPTVDQGGVRVHGRIDLNSAPWPVLAGLPLVPRTSLPAPFKTKIQNVLFPSGDPDENSAWAIGSELAKSIVVYREARTITGTADFGFGISHASGLGHRWREDTDPASLGTAYTGFLTVGELANVRRNGGGGALFDIDSGVIDGSANEDFITAAAVLIALGDWVSTRSHVFTVYGTLRGAGTKSLVDQKAVRFQETVDRMPCFFDTVPPQRIGERIVGSYFNAASN